MRRRTTLLALLFIAALTTFSFYVVWPEGPEQYLPSFIPWPKGHGLSIGAFGFERRSMRLGLDLRGGTRIVLEADISQTPGIDLDQAVEGAMDIIERRVNAFGVAESEVQRQGSNRISVQLPGIEPAEARRLVGRTALLEFRELPRDNSGNLPCMAQDGSTFAGGLALGPDGKAIAIGPFMSLCQELSAAQGAEPRLGIMTWLPAAAAGADGVAEQLTGRHLKSNSQVLFDTVGRPEVAFETTEEGKPLLAEVTTRLVGKPLGIFLDEEYVSSPTVQGALTEGRGVITGVELSEARDLAKLLNIGALPVAMRPVQEQEVDATLGSDSVRKSVQAGEIAILTVMAFMVLYYRLPGVLASAALVVYGSTTMMVFKLLPITMTLAGIGAFVLSVGMAVDANILIFERVKEELRGGRSLRTAIDLGFRRAWTSIRDSNVSTLITCAILWWFGDQFGAAPVKGFALTLAIGVAISMFSAIFVSRTFLQLALEMRWSRRRRRLWLVEPAVAAAASGPPLRQEER